MTKLKLNLGCGFKKIDGFINVDGQPACNPDLIFDIEQTPWPWLDSSVSEVHLIHVLEHLGANSTVYLNIIKELYRVCENEASIYIEVPHHRCDDFYSDPTHVRPITIKGLHMFNREINNAWVAQGDAATPLALYTGVDFYIRNYEYQLNKILISKIYPNEITKEQEDILINTHANIVIALKVHWIARKLTNL
jgi:hypothetical protein